MKIRSQLNVLVVAVVAPIALLAAVVTAELWDLQRAAYGRLSLERVSALRLALDTELEGIQRSLRGLAEVPNLDTEQGLPAFRDRFPRLLASAEGRDVLLVALTGYGSESDRSKAFEAGFDDFLVKPFDLAKFEAAASRAR